MAELSFKRHESGGSFKRPNLGDGGVRGYKEQQDQITDSIRLQQLRSSEYSSDYLKALQRVDQSEAENRQIIKEMEDKAWQLRRDSIAKRGQLEVEMLQSKAKEYGKKKDFWMDFSTTYAKQWGELAQGLTDVSMKKAAISDINALHATEKQGELYTTESSDAADGIESSGTQMLVEASQKEQTNIGKAKINKLWENTNGFRDVMIADLYRTKFPALLRKLEGDFIREGRPQSEFAAAALELGAQLQEKYNIGNTKGGREFRKIVDSSIHVVLNEHSQEENKAAIEDNYNFAVKAYELNATDTNFMQLITAAERKHNTTGNPRATVLALVEDQGLMGYGSVEELIEAIGSGPNPISTNERIMLKTIKTDDGKVEISPHPYPGRKGSEKTAYYKETGWFELRFKGNKGAENRAVLEEQIMEAVEKWEVKQITKENESLKTAGRRELISVRQRFDAANKPVYADDGKTLIGGREDFIDVTTEKGYRDALKLLSTYRSYQGFDRTSNPARFITDQLGLKPGTINVNSAERDFLIAWKRNDAPDMRRAYRLLSAEQRTTHEHKLSLPDVLEGTDMSTPSQIRMRAQQVVHQKRNKGAKLTTTDKLDEQTIRVSEALQDTFFTKLKNKLKDRKVYEKEYGPDWKDHMVQEVSDDTLEFFNKENGLFEIESAAETDTGQIDFKNFKAGRTNIDAEIPTNDLYNPENREIYMEEEIKNGKSTGRYTMVNTKAKVPLVSRRHLVEIAKQINAGQTFYIPDNIKLMSQVTGYYELDILNKMLTDSGFTVQAKQGLIQQQVKKAALFKKRYNESMKALNATKQLECEVLAQTNPEAIIALCTNAVAKAKEAMKQQDLINQRKQFNEQLRQHAASYRTGQSGINQNTGNIFNQLGDK